MTSARLHRTMNTAIREGLTTMELWSGSDKGLIWCWERGRQKGSEEPELAARARQGELVALSWRRGTLRLPSQKRTASDENGSLHYLATWQGLRGDDLDITLDGEVEIVCTKTGMSAVFKRR